MIQGVIFDMDGLMFDTEPVWATFWVPALAALGLPYREGLAEACRGAGRAACCGNLRRFYGEDCPAEAVMDTFFALAEQHFLTVAPPAKPGLLALLDTLRAAGLPLAVASSSRVELIEHHLAAHGLTGRFAAVLSGTMVQHSKPAPDIFLLAAERLGLAPADCLVLEDSYNGVRAGAAGGFVTVMVPDLLPADEEMRRLIARECASLHEVRQALLNGEL